MAQICYDTFYGTAVSGTAATTGECLMVRFAILVTVICGLLVAGLGTAFAQEASPVASPVAGIACTGEPRSADDLLALWYAPDGTPIGSWATPVADEELTEITIPIGAPADDATTAAVTAVVEEVFACFDAGDSLRAFALFTDDLAAMFGPEPGTSFEDAQAFVTAPAEPAPPGEESEIVAVTNAVTLADGRVGAFVIERFGGIVSASYAIFEQDGDQWLVDEVIEFPSPIDEE